MAAREQFLSTVLGRVTVGVAVVDAEDQVVVLNPAGAHILTDFRPEVDEKRGVIQLMGDFRKLGPGTGRAAGEALRSAVPLSRQKPRISSQRKAPAGGE